VKEQFPKEGIKLFVMEAVQQVEKHTCFYLSEAAV
jgi:hypothetical protein